jgi:hypothetical protein
MRRANNATFELLGNPCGMYPYGAAIVNSTESAAASPRFIFAEGRADMVLYLQQHPRRFGREQRIHDGRWNQPRRDVSRQLQRGEGSAMSIACQAASSPICLRPYTY